MPLRELKISDFRCLQNVLLEPGERFSLVYGSNASGKTSLLEAVGYLGRGKSFLGAPTQSLVRHGCREFLLVGTVDAGGRDARVGVRNGPGGLELRVDGQDGAGGAQLAGLLPLQIIGPDIHDLVAGGPEQRRRHLDWIAFHVERGYLDTWRRFRRALRQRNAALRQKADTKTMLAWDQEFLSAATEINTVRMATAARLNKTLESRGDLLLGHVVRVEYRQGWPLDQKLEEALVAGNAREREAGNTQYGPHRADLKLIMEERQARKLVSRGQQKLLACGLVLGASEIVQNQLDRSLLLLLDDPAAELDEVSLSRLMAAVVELDCQVIATSLRPDIGLFPTPPSVFHVEHGQLEKAG